MCGICGIHNVSGASESILNRMSAALHHRGPDDEGSWTSGTVGLASRRLSIIDLTSGHQPISNEDDSIRLVFNGEIYNFAALRSDLLGRGHRFRTNTDTETIVHLYEECGTDCVQHLSGMFAFALWDGNARRLFLARDPVGQKPLYFCQLGDDFLFASEIKALLEHPKMPRRLDLQAMHDCLSLRCVTGSRTLLEGISKLPAGHTLTLEAGQISIAEYWDLRFVPKTRRPQTEIVVELRELLARTVETHLVADVPVGAFLSGGIDSSLLVALMSRQVASPVPTFAIGTGESSFNELPYARQLAQHCGTDHHECVVQPDVVTTLPQMIHFMEEPVDPFAFGVFAAARLASQHVKVVLGGDGGDEMFAGYDRYLGHQLVDAYCWLPAPLRRYVLEPVFQRLPDGYRYNNRVQKLRWLAAMSHTSGAQRYAESACFLRFTHAHKKELYGARTWQALGHFDATEQLLSYFNADNAADLVDRMLYTDIKTRLADHLLMVTDRMTMAHSIEGRSPYVDRDVTEYVARIPAHLKIHGRRLKHVLREACRGLVPEELIRRKKQGFSFPLAFWFRHELRDLATELLTKGSMVEAGYFRAEGIRELLQQHIAGRVDHNYRLWLLLNFELWHRLFIEQQPQSSVTELISDHLHATQLALV